MINDVLSDLQTSIGKAHDACKRDLVKLRAGRASAEMIAGVRVDYYGTPTPISQMASITVPEPRQIVIKPFDASILKELERAILKSDLGITPQNDGKLLRLTMPALSQDQRKKYAAKVKDIAEETRVAMRNVRRDQNKVAESAHKGGSLTEDDHKRVQDEIQKALKEYEDKVTGLLERKTAEIMEV